MDASFYEIEQAILHVKPDYLFLSLPCCLMLTDNKSSCIIRMKKKLKSPIGRVVLRGYAVLFVIGLQKCNKQALIMCAVLAENLIRRLAINLFSIVIFL